MSRATRFSWFINGKNEVVDLDKETITIGRLPDCDVVIRDDRTSKRHARVVYENGKWTIVDLGAANGTMVNERRIVKQEVHDGDTITAGSVRLRFQERRLQSSTEPKVVFKEERTQRNFTHQINVEELRTLLGGGGTSRKEIVPGAAAPVASWVVPVFSQAAQALVSVQTRDELLSKVMDIVVNSMPVERGVIALYDETTQDVIPVVTRSKENNPADTISISRTIANEAITGKRSVLYDDRNQDDKFSQEESILHMNIRAAMCSPIVNEGEVLGVIYVDTQAKLGSYTKDHLNVLGTLAILTAVGIEQIRMREESAHQNQIREQLSRFMSPNMVERIVNQGASAGELKPELRELSVIFADLSGFTTMSESMKPTEVAALLNTVFEHLTEVIFNLGGTLDKYMGDAIMAFFGAPEPQPDHALRAVHAAIKMQAELTRINEELSSATPIRMRVGINSGEVVVGPIGSPKRKDYTVIGDVVNIASRLESGVAKPGQIVIGTRTHELVKDVVECDDLGELKLKGKNTGFRPYLVQKVRESATLGS